MALELFHTAVASWFESHFSAPTPVQSLAWPSIKDGSHTLISAPTGSGKTLAAFLSAIDDLVRMGVEKNLSDTTHVLYVSPLKALSNDIQKNLQLPLMGIQERLRSMGLDCEPIRVLVRTGDTSQSERTAMARRPPHIVVTTPESLFILLTSESGRRMLKTVKTLIVDEIHALVDDKRGAHLALSIERLEQLTGSGLTRIGLSATQSPIEEVARFLVGSENIDKETPRCNIINCGHIRRLDIDIEVPGSPLEAVMSGEVWEEVYNRLSNLILEHRTTLVFVNTRRTAERVAKHLAERLGTDKVTAHHGSLAKEQRLSAEKRLKSGELRALVATASLELGIDIGSIDLVCQLGSTKTIATFLQRIGRAGHNVGGTPKGRLFPLSRDELVEAAALIQSVNVGDLDRLTIPQNSLDILAQQIVAIVATDEWSEEGLFSLVKRAYPYRGLRREDFDSVIRMLSEGFSTSRGRRAALVHYDMVNRKVRGRRGARLAAITSGGAIPDTADYTVILEPAGTVIGTVNEDFAVESLQGDIFQLGNTSWKVIRVGEGRVLVEDAQGQPPSIPFWLGEAPGRSPELSLAVSKLRISVTEQKSVKQAIEWLMNEIGLKHEAAEQIAVYLCSSKTVLGTIPSHETLVMERFFDESGGMQLVIHSIFGSRVNRAWGLALRKRFCRKFNFELQAAATEDSIVLSLGAAQSFPLEDVFNYLHSKSVRDLLVQALLDAPMFEIRWRWNATRSLAILRRRGGKKIPPQLQRMLAEDLLCAVFPEQVACAENLQGPREIPDHPLVNQTIRDCLEEAMDIDQLESLLRSIEEGQIDLLAKDLREPSPLSQEILTARPWAFLDDVPLEERRTHAVRSRRWLDPETADDLGKLDESAIERVKEEAWPQAETKDELHDALSQLGFITVEELKRETEWANLFEELVTENRATRLKLADGTTFFVPAERVPQLRCVYAKSILDPELLLPEKIDSENWSFEEALVDLLRSRLESLGPVTAQTLSATMALPKETVETSLLALESEGSILRGRFTPGGGETEWCIRRLLSRIHNYTIKRLRKEIEPVHQSDFMRFLFAWQKVSADYQKEGPTSLAEIVEQLEGFEAPAVAWEGDILPSRIKDYDPQWLDNLCSLGKIIWGRLRVRRPVDGKASSPIRSTPISLLSRKHLNHWDILYPRLNQEEISMTPAAREVLDHLIRNGALFFSDIMEEARLLRTQVEEALGELASLGLITADSFTGLRALLNRRAPGPVRKRKNVARIFDMENAGRWTRFNATRKPDLEPGVATEFLARLYLRRYGVVFRKLLEGESPTVPWRDFLKVYRRLEARGEIRGGRFVHGFSGEQFALSDAISLMRSIRKIEPSGLLISISAADPLNLVGIITPGPKVLSVASNRVLFKDGIPVALHESGKISLLIEMTPSEEWKARSALLRRNFPSQLRGYIGQSAGSSGYLKEKFGS
jgi:ATP-dependent helicase Lhr and Lhr-like helicase